eukprot:g38141.t1
MELLGINFDKNHCISLQTSFAKPHSGRRCVVVPTTPQLLQGIGGTQLLGVFHGNEARPILRNTRDSGSEQKTVMSSMNRKALICRPLLPRIVTPLSLAFFLMDTAKGPIQYTNKAGESGKPCLTPDLIGELSDSQPLIETALLML